MFRPRLILGVFLIGFGVFSYLLNPGMRSALGVVVLGIVCVLGLIAVVMDLRIFWLEMKKAAERERNNHHEV